MVPQQRANAAAAVWYETEIAIRLSVSRFFSSLRFFISGKKEIPGRFGWTCAATESTDVGLHLMSSSVRERLQLLSSSSELTAVPAARSLLLIATTGFRRCRVVSASTVPDSARLVFQFCLFLLSDLVFVLSCSRETIFPRWTSK